MKLGRLGLGIILCLTLAGQAVRAAAPVELRKGPYLIFPGEPSRMQVLWQLDSTRLCTLAWGATDLYESGLTTTTEYGPDHQHAAIGNRKPACHARDQYHAGTHTVTHRADNPGKAAADPGQTVHQDTAV